MEIPIANRLVIHNPDPSTAEYQQLTPGQKNLIYVYNSAVFTALDELGWEGDPPTLFFSDPLIVNHTPKPGGVTQTSQYYQKEPHYFLEIGTEIAEKAFAGASIQGMKRFGLTDDQIKTIAAISIAFEETFHWVELMRGANIPSGPQGLLPGYTTEQYGDQPHERRAGEFQLQMLNKYLFALTGIVAEFE